MRKNSIRKLIHGILDLLPLFVIPIFAININQKSVEPISIEIQQNKVINFNQQFNDNFNEYSQENWSLSLNEHVYTIESTGVSTKYELIENPLIAGHKYYIRQTYSNEDVHNLTTFLVGIRDSASYKYFEPTIFTATTTMSGFAWRLNTNYVCVISFTVNLYDLTQMDLENITIQEFDNLYPSNYYDYVESKKEMITLTTPTTYDNTDIGSQFLYSLYISTDKYFNMNNVFNLNSVYQWFEMNIFNGTAPLSIYIVWNIIIYELVMDLLMLLYALFMFFIDACQKLIDKPLNSIK